jgi:hypothetical protein
LKNFIKRKILADEKIQNRQPQKQPRQNYCGNENEFFHTPPRLVNVAFASENRAQSSASLLEQNRPNKQ